MEKEIKKYKMLSVLVPTYNSGGKVVDTLQSLSAQILGEGFSYEVLVIDNNSNDNSKEAINNFIKDYREVFFYYFESKQGKGNALNTGIIYANGEIVAVTDDDCIVDIHWVQNILNIFNSRSIDLLTGRIIAVFKSKLPKWLNPQLLHAPFGHIDAGGDYFENDASKISYGGANMAFTKKGIMKYGHFSLLCNRGEDVVFFEHWVAQGAKFAYAPNVIVEHINSPQRVSKEYLKKWYILAGMGQKNTIWCGANKQRSFLGVPYWIYKKIIGSAFQMLRFYFTKQDLSYFYRTKIYHSVGVILALWGVESKHQNLR